MRTLLAMVAACVIGCLCAPLIGEAALDQQAIKVEERVIIEGKARMCLKLPRDATLRPAEFARVSELDLHGEAITDAGLQWLADPATGLKGLATLNLGNTKVTDAGLKDLAREGTGLSTLTTLLLHGTKVTDAGARDLARPQTGLKSLTTLNLDSTKVTDAGVRGLTRHRLASRLSPRSISATHR